MVCVIWLKNRQNANKTAKNEMYRDKLEMYQWYLTTTRDRPSKAEQPMIAGSTGRSRLQCASWPISDKGERKEGRKIGTGEVALIKRHLVSTLWVFNHKNNYQKTTTNPESKQKLAKDETKIFCWKKLNESLVGVWTCYQRCYNIHPYLLDIFCAWYVSTYTSWKRVWRSSMQLCAVHNALD